ncbi:MAG: hypothetical protein ACP5KW_12090 [Thermoproteota archaeon]
MVFLRLKEEDYEVWVKAKAYAKEHGITLGKMVALALLSYINREDKILNELEEIKELLRNNRTAVQTTTNSQEPRKTSPNLPNISYFKDNPWLQILSNRGRE